MSNLYITQDIVKEMLENHPFTRNSDSKLYVKVCEKIAPEAIGKPFWYVLGNLKEWNLPGFETVRRARQKLQVLHPELAACSDVESGRMVREEEFRDYARRKW